MASRQGDPLLSGRPSSAQRPPPPPPPPPPPAPPAPPPARRPPPPPPRCLHTLPIMNEWLDQSLCRGAGHDWFSVTITGMGGNSIEQWRARCQHNIYRIRLGNRIRIAF